MIKTARCGNEFCKLRRARGGQGRPFSREGVAAGEGGGNDGKLVNNCLFEPGPVVLEPRRRRRLVFVDTYLASTPKVVQIRRDLVRFCEEDLAPSDVLSLAILGPGGGLKIATGLNRETAARLAREIAPPLGRFRTPLFNSY